MSAIKPLRLNPHHLQQLFQGRHRLWEPVIGLELHCQLHIFGKLFSPESRRTSPPFAPNRQVTLVDAAFPGVLPRLNADGLAKAVQAVTALGGQVQTVSRFDRKQYFYPDLPTGYQITQRGQPIGLGATAAQLLEPVRGIRIEQIQLEQDTAKSIHGAVEGADLIDYNRAGVALIEIVLAPDIRSAREAVVVIRKLQELLRAAGISEARMDEGSLRCDVNVSEDRKGGIRVELKNLNSLKLIYHAIQAEITRHITILESDPASAPAGQTEQRLQQETRGFDPVRRSTFRLRSKEDAPDYRYMPDTDVPVVRLTPAYVAHTTAAIPELPDARRRRLHTEYGLGLADCHGLMSQSGAVAFFEKVQQATQLPATHIGLDQDMRISFDTHPPVSVKQLASILTAIEQRLISGKIGKEILSLMLNGDTRDAFELIEAKGLRQVTDNQLIQTMCRSVVNNNPAELQKYRAGKQRIFGWFVGQIIKETKGKASPTLAKEILQKYLDQLK
ncbi:aspartyl/glutamyl-tRNA amidotransferase subunit B [Dimargaris cristalligena]|uniref:Glutamyl-tRNA(Gln) amidotransferase subunit B, mitochondrial n=1 Tax=Dimargaris cristalligena TaxID=215637 RepID=A0A4P9ZXU9_9FUNG|nr:aspartyl/glutamyl-tRNA amidotransferase subunit B [Dimargaris cristalligena]|eukprot:RKP38514.1 aspartyl/glutamyl-tRNA amidotransferase subunit B [Dimargaris cristalligena]